MTRVKFESRGGGGGGDSLENCISTSSRLDPQQQKQNISGDQKVQGSGLDAAEEAAEAMAAIQVGRLGL